MSEPVPPEFTRQAVEAASGPNAFTPYKAYLDSVGAEPMKSLLQNNPWMAIPTTKLEWGKGNYYDTTVARKHPYWEDKSLPRPTKDMNQLRKDFVEWGFCMIQDGTSPSQTAALRKRCEEQCEAERALGIAQFNAAQQLLWGSVNKGAIFRKLLDFDPEVVQAGPMIEQLGEEFVGHDWNHLSLVSNVSYPGCFPQGLHQDQGFLKAFSTPAPLMVNIIYILQDVNEVNGGTLLIPGSHRMQDANGVFGKLPPTINLEAPGGTVVLMDGRVVHGGACNRSDKLRFIITNPIVPPYVKQQENFLLSTAPEVLAKCSPKLLMRLGFQALTTRNIVEGYGIRGNGKAGDPNGSVIHVRRAIDKGNYVRVGELKPEDVSKVDLSKFGLASFQANETYRNDEYRKKMARI